ncbi:hypothetical protein GCM10023322_25970 [Rugosimonospora acidiphila]|uniref:Uncharacterized protein n=1 Tax=Rugosimonospora acidiphila TaxID=556531 RepID=A0ABP9RQC0_9ACTN
MSRRDGWRAGGVPGGRSPADHAGYQADRFPTLRRDADVGRDLAKIVGDAIEVHDGWTVLPSAPTGREG